MAHATSEKARPNQTVLRRIRGQMEAVKPLPGRERSCATVLQLIAEVRGQWLMAEVVEEHVILHVADQALGQDQRNEGAAELVDVVRPI